MGTMACYVKCRVCADDHKRLKSHSFFSSRAWPLQGPGTLDKPQPFKQVRAPIAAHGTGPRRGSRAGWCNGCGVSTGGEWSRSGEAGPAERAQRGEAWAVGVLRAAVAKGHGCGIDVKQRVF